MEFAFHNRFFRPALPPSPRAVIQTGVSLCAVRKTSSPLFSTSRPRRSSTTGDITDYFVRPRSPSTPAFSPSSADHPCRTDSGPDRGHKDVDICDGHRDAITCAIRHAGPLPRRLRCTSRLRLSVCLARASLRFSVFSPRAPLCLFPYPRPSLTCAAELRARVPVCRAQCARPVCAQKGVAARTVPQSAQSGAAVEDDAAGARAA